MKFSFNIAAETYQKNSQSYVDKPFSCPIEFYNNEKLSTINGLKNFVLILGVWIFAVLTFIECYKSFTQHILRL